MSVKPVKDTRHHQEYCGSEEVYCDLCGTDDTRTYPAEQMTAIEGRVLGAALWVCPKHLYRLRIDLAAHVESAPHLVYRGKKPMVEAFLKTKGEMLRRATALNQDRERRMEEQIFLGSGDHSVRDTALLHLILDDALMHLSGIQQTPRPNPDRVEVDEDVPPWGKDPRVEEAKRKRDEMYRESEAFIYQAANDISTALGVGSERRDIFYGRPRKEVEREAEEMAKLVREAFLKAHGPRPRRQPNPDVE